MPRFRASLGACAQPHSDRQLAGRGNLNGDSDDLASWAKAMEHLTGWDMSMCLSYCRGFKLQTGIVATSNKRAKNGHVEFYVCGETRRMRPRDAVEMTRAMMSCITVSRAAAHEES
jgi:hypothetical protein